MRHVTQHNELRRKWTLAQERMETLLNNQLEHNLFIIYDLKSINDKEMK